MKLVLVYKEDSQYYDTRDVQYDFPQRYLAAAKQGVGDWAVYYNPVKAGGQGYFAVAKFTEVIPNPRAEGRYLALIAQGSFLPFDQDVPRLENGRPWEAMLAGEDGRPITGGAVQLAVRRLPEAEFERLVSKGLPQDLEEDEMRRYDPRRDIDDQAEPFARPVLERLTRRPFRDVAFRRRVREAYDYRCAVSGLRLRNGGGRPEVQAAHIRPVERGGSDAVWNGLALSGTLHWMFDRGLISVADDLSILVSRNKVPPEVVQRLLPPSGKLIPPNDERDRPHPANLRWHRENIYGQGREDGSAPWG